MRANCKSFYDVKYKFIGHLVEPEEAKYVAAGAATKLNCFCQFCTDGRVLKVANSIKDGTLFCCEKKACQQQRADIVAARRQNTIVSGKGSFAALHPQLANEFLGFVDERHQHLSLAQVPEHCTFDGLWQCQTTTYHQYVLSPSDRLNYGCGFCPGGTQLHPLDSAFHFLKENGWLHYLHEDDIERSKQVRVNTNEPLLHFNCRTCAEARQPSNTYTFAQADGCTQCRGSYQKTITKRQLKKSGSVADNPYLVSTYCFDQPWAPEKYRNKTPPSDVPAMDNRQSYWWRCNSKHFDLRTPLVQSNRRCNKCSSATSKLEHFIYHEWQVRFPDDDIELRKKWKPHDLPKHVKPIHKKTTLEADLIINTFAIEFDGVYFHLTLNNKLSNDQDKNKRLQALGFEVIRIRETGLKTTNKDNSEDPIIEFLDVDLTDHLSIFNKILAVIRPDEAPIDTFRSEKAALQAFLEGKDNNVTSVSELYPELLRYTSHENAKLLERLSKSAHESMEWHCPTCHYIWPQSIRHRMIGWDAGVDSPACCRQTVWTGNSIATTHPSLERLIHPLIWKNHADELGAWQDKWVLVKGQNKAKQTVWLQFELYRIVKKIENSPELVFIKQTNQVRPVITDEQITLYAKDSEALLFDLQTGKIKEN
ncbi:MAG: hypothetical protein GJ680_07360 [Alteromonadaceae bacterium]|nr:hypothetical protein [Alteromonadaceae bacterium]